MEDGSRDELEEENEMDEWWGQRGRHGRAARRVQVLGVLEPVRGHPLRLALQAVDLVEQLLVGTLCVVIYDYHVE